MADVHTPEQRSRNMSRVRSSGNRTTELLMIRLLKTSKVNGWRRHYSVFGNPDLVFPKRRIAVFIDGCFWHGCRRGCRSIPATNADFWMAKIAINKQRDRLVNKTLRRAGWTVLRFWEHELRMSPRRVVGRVRFALERSDEEYN